MVAQHLTETLLAFPLIHHLEGISITVTDVALCHHHFNNNVLMLSLLIEVYIIKTI